MENNQNRTETAEDPMGSADAKLGIMAMQFCPPDQAKATPEVTAKFKELMAQLNALDPESVESVVLLVRTNKEQDGKAGFALSGAIIGPDVLLVPSLLILSGQIASKTMARRVHDETQLEVPKCDGCKNLVEESGGCAQSCATQEAVGKTQAEPEKAEPPSVAVEAPNTIQ